MSQVFFILLMVVGAAIAGSSSGSSSSSSSEEFEDVVITKDIAVAAAPIDTIQGINQQPKLTAPIDATNGYLETSPVEKNQEAGFSGYSSESEAGFSGYNSESEEDDD